MKRQLLRMVCVLALVLVGGACAQTISMKTDIPFDFIVNGGTLPAGQYVVESFGASSSPVLLVHNVKFGQAEVVPSNPTESLEASEKTKLVFHRYGNQYFLAQIWIAGQRFGRELPNSKREAETMAHVQHDTIMIAGAP